MEQASRAMKQKLRIYQLARKISLETSIHCDRMEKNAETCLECKKTVLALTNEIIRLAQEPVPAK